MCVTPLFISQNVRRVTDGRALVSPVRCAKQSDIEFRGGHTFEDTANCSELLNRSNFSRLTEKKKRWVCRWASGCWSCWNVPETVAKVGKRRGVKNYTGRRTSHEFHEVSHLLPQSLVIFNIIKLPAVGAFATQITDNNALAENAKNALLTRRVNTM